MVKSQPYTYVYTRTYIHTHIHVLTPSHVSTYINIYRTKSVYNQTSHQSYNLIIPWNDKKKSHRYDIM